MNRIKEQSVTYTFKLGRTKPNPNYKRQFFFESLQTNQQLRQYLLITALVALAITVIAASIVISLGTKLLFWIGLIG